MDFPEDMPEELKKLLKAFEQGSFKGICVKTDKDGTEISEVGGNDIPKDNTIFGHYGVKLTDFNKWTKEILADMLTKDAKSDVLDKHFSQLDGEGRIKVVAYAEALSKFKSLYK